MILVLAGTHEQPFHRLMALAGDLAESTHVVAQHGHTPPGRPRPHLTWIDFLSFENLEQLIRRSRVVVAHAGVGTIMTALRHQRRPIVVPRLRRLGEHVDDHQLEIADAFEQKGLVVSLFPADDPRLAMQRATLPTAGVGSCAQELLEAVRGEVGL